MAASAPFLIFKPNFEFGAIFKLTTAFWISAFLNLTYISAIFKDGCQRIIFNFVNLTFEFGA